MMERTQEFIKRIMAKPIQGFVAYFAVSILLFLPVLNKNFAADDFTVLYRIINQHNFLLKGFFRPLSDITLYLNYLMAGTHSFYYNLTNIAIHAGCSYLIFIFCMMENGLVLKNKFRFAAVSSGLFLIYPFHNEAILWVLGRGALISSFFGFLALIVSNSKMALVRKIVLVCSFYFIGLCAYEIIFPLPFIVLLMEINKKNETRYPALVSIWLSITLLLNLILRYSLSGSLFGTYANKMFTASIGFYLSSIPKNLGRLFLPPSASSNWLMLSFVLLFILLTGLCYWLLIKKHVDKLSFYRVSLSLLLCCFIPILFGISTRTYEGDRLLYFASFFLAMWISLLVDALPNERIKQVVWPVTLAYFLINFYFNIALWRKAGRFTGDIIQSVAHVNRNGGIIYLVNLPEELNGALLFRNGFYESLKLNNIDTSGIEIVNYLSTEDAIKVEGDIYPTIQNTSLALAPHFLLRGDSIFARIRASNNDSLRLGIKSNDKIYFWNKQTLELLKR